MKGLRQNEGASKPRKKRVKVSVAPWKSVEVKDFLETENVEEPDKERANAPAPLKKKRKQNIESFSEDDVSGYSVKDTMISICPLSMKMTPKIYPQPSQQNLFFA